MNPTLILHHAEQLITLDTQWINDENPLGVIPKGALAAESGKIVWVGKTSDIALADYPNAECLDVSGQIVLPGLIDSHTHPVFAGNRADEFEQRLQGVTYQEIAAQGGGIQKTVQATRHASEEELFLLTQQRLQSMLRFGVTTVEAKSGYGLDWETELKSLRVLQHLQESLPLTICPTYMGAHDIPLEYKGRTDAYVSLLCQEQIPAVAELGLARFCDVFCEAGYFSVAQSRTLLETARDFGLALKVHAEEFTDLGGAQLAGELGAVSADHLLHISDAGIQGLKQGGTVATLLPGTAFYLRLPYAPAQKIIAAGVPVALATDFNPGSCMTENLQLIMTLGCVGMGMLPQDVIKGVTLHAAQALGLAHDRGSLTTGKRADLALFNTTSYNELLYHFGVNPLQQVFIAGERIAISSL